MTKVIAINGSPRKNWNTAIMLQSALEGAASYHGLFNRVGAYMNINVLVTFEQ